ncbi:hypothetical protein AS026_19945 [Rhizobium altiplani]|uniref:Uncharacterized protein n=1 Tax=Rhizobium altiplani TaxID=1864509 RepID=A0A109J723_9HYPH|nr:hypothetical protein AS026_19945 [Rhizobium altiplani]
MSSAANFVCGRMHDKFFGFLYILLSMFIASSSMWTLAFDAEIDGVLARKRCRRDIGRLQRLL